MKVENGVVECNKKTCKLKKCNRGFHRLKTDPSQGLVLIADPGTFKGFIASTHNWLQTKTHSVFPIVYGPYIMVDLADLAF